MEVLETKELCKNFGSLEAVNRVDFKLEKGELRSIIGPNGAGKTTFFNVLTGMLAPSSGDIGQERCPIMDTWWQTETGGFLISPLPITPLKPGSATFPFPGVAPKIIREDGSECDAEEGGSLVIAKPWPGMLRGFWNDSDRKTYMEQLNRLDTSGVEPTSHAIPVYNVFREDEVKPSFPQEEVLAIAPDEGEGPQVAIPTEIFGAPG